MRVNHLEFLPHQQRLDGEVMRAVLTARSEACFEGFGVQDVREVLSKPNLNSRDLQVLLSPAAGELLEELAARAKALKEQFFGKNIYFFTPLYIDNHCDNNCTYCGFNKHNKIRRMQLSEGQIAAELDNIAAAGFSEVLLLTGEMDDAEYVKYIAKACALARQRFANVGVEVYPLNVGGYELLRQSGADFVTIFQETYNQAAYEKFHIEGNKRIFPYRFEGQERALKGGMRGVGFAALLGLDEWRRDAFATAFHAYSLQKRYPHAEISLSVPRIRPTLTNKNFAKKCGVTERELVQVIAAYRIFLPFANITLSSRESPFFRDNALRLGVSKVSAGVSVGIGTHGSSSEQGDGQFEIADARSLAQMKESILNAGLTPVANDSVFV